MEIKRQLYDFKNIYLLILLPLTFCIGQAAVSFYFFFCSIVFLYLFYKKNILFEKKNLIFFFLIIFFSLIIIANFISLGFYNLFDKTILYLRFLFFFFLGAFFFKKISNRFNRYQFIYFTFLSALIIFVLVDGYYQYFNVDKVDIFGFKPLPEHSQRLTGIFGKEPIIGSFLFHIGFPAIIFLISYINKKVFNLFYNIISNTLVIFIYLTLILLSGERISFLMTVLAFFLVISLFQVNKIKIFLSFILFLFFFYLMVLHNSYVKQRYFDFISEISLSSLKSKNNALPEINKNKNFFDSQWGAHYLTAIEMFKTKPLFGIGMGQFRNDCSNKKYETINSNSKEIRCTSHPHNIYLEIFSETGIFVGFAFIMFMIIFLFKVIRVILLKNIKNFKDKIEYNVFLSFFAVSLTIFFPIKSSGSFYSNFYGSFIWYNLTALYIYLQYFNNLIEYKDK
jgi:O-antigen ligase